MEIDQVTPKSVKTKAKRGPRSKQPNKSSGVTHGQNSRGQHTNPHARAAALTDRGERADYLFDLMVDARFAWTTTDELAALWKCHPSTVREYAAEARRRYIREVERAGRDDYRARIMGRIDFVGRDALERTEEVVDAMGTVHTVRRPDHRTARQSLLDLAQLGGLLVHKHEVTINELTDEEIRAQLRAHGLEVRTIETTAEPALGEGDAHDGEGGSHGPA